MTAPRPSVTAVVSQFPAPSQTFILRKLTGLRDQGVDVTVASTTFGPDAAALGMHLLPLTPWARPSTAASPISRPAWRAVARAATTRPSSGADPRSIKRRLALSPLLGTDSDIVHFEFSGIAVTYRQVLDQLRPAKLAVSCRGAAEQIVPLSDPTRAGLLAEVFDQMDLVHCVSDDIRRTAEQLGAPPERIVVNRPAVPVDDFVPLASQRSNAPEHRGLRVLSIGRLHWKKGFDDALVAIAALRRRGVDVNYRIAGEGPEREKLAFLLDEYDLTGSATLLGTATQQQIQEQLVWADVLLLPSLSEGISNAVLEAMSAGLPVVSTDCGGMREVITDAVDGFLVAPGDTSAMADRLEDLAKDADRRAQIGASAMARAVAEFDLSRQIGVFLDAYEQITTR